MRFPILVNSRWMTLLGIVFFTLLLTILLADRTSVTMDEFLVYHALACKTQPFNDVWNGGREPCRGFDLAPFSWLTTERIYLPARSYGYVGSLQGLFYLPLYLIWKHPYSAKFFGVFLIGVQAALISSVFSHSVWLVLGVLLLFMPYVFQHFADVGQLSLTTTSVFLLVFLCKRWIADLVASRRRAWFIVTAIGLLNFVILLFRVNNVAYMPTYLTIQALCVWFFGLKMVWEFRRQAFILQSVWAAFIFLCGSFIWFTAVDRWGNPLYTSFLNPSDRVATGGGIWLSISVIWKHFEVALAQYLIRPLLSAHVEHAINFDSPLEGIELWIIIGLILIISWFFAPVRRFRLFSFLCLLIFAGGIFSISAVSRSWGMHHLIPVYPILLIAIFSTLPPRIGPAIGCLLAAFALVNIRLYALLSQLDPLAHEFDGRLIALNDEINERFAKSHLIIVGSWGIYYTKLVYGPRDQSVIWADTWDSSAIQAAKRADQAAGKPALFVLRGEPPEEYWKNFARAIERVDTKVQIADWSLWREVT